MLGSGVLGGGGGVYPGSSMRLHLHRRHELRRRTADHRGRLRPELCQGGETRCAVYAGRIEVGSEWVFFSRES
ncbi:hypothetical protein Hanom_Chr03g00221061 [Helianthus anomalus]